MRDYPILILDEDRASLDRLGPILEGQGYKVTTADTTKAAVEMIKKRDFGLLIADLEAGQTDGTDILVAAKELKPNIMAIILTGRRDEKCIADALRLGADDFMLKPVTFSELSFRVSLCMQRLDLQQTSKSEKRLSMCCVCKKIYHGPGKKWDKKEWVPVEKYISEKTKLDVTSAYCPECQEICLTELGKMYNIKPAVALFGTAPTSNKEDR